MKRLFWIFLLILTTTPHTLAQGIRHKDQPDEWFYLAKQLYAEGSYAAGYRALSTWFERSGQASFLEEATFLKAKISFELNKKDASIILIDFIRQYPLSVHLTEAYYLLGSTALEAKQFEDAALFFKQCPESMLDPKELDAFLFKLAYTHLQLKQFDTARSVFTRLLQSENRFIPSSTYFMAYMDYAEGKIQSARVGFNKVSDQAQYRAVSDFFNLQLLYMDGNYDETIVKAEAMLKQKPTLEQSIELVRLLGAALFDKKRYATSLLYYQEYLRFVQNPGRSDVYRIGVNYFSQFNDVQAISYLTQVLDKKDAISQSALYHMGLSYVRQNKKEQARLHFEEASNQTFDKQTQEKALYNFALICYEDTYSPFNEQAKAFQKLLTEFPQSTYTTTANSLLSDVLLSSKDHSGSLKFVESLQNPDEKMLQTKCKLLFLTGVDRYKAQKYTEAQELFTNATALALEHRFPMGELLYWKAECNDKLGFLKEAVEDYISFVSNPENGKNKAFNLAHYQLGYAFFKQKMYDEASQWFEKFIQLKSNGNENLQIDAMNRIADCLYIGKNIGQAEKYYVQAQTVSKNTDDYAVYQLAMCQGAKKQYQEKIRLLTVFEQKYSKSVYLDRALWELGQTQLSQNQKEEAAQTFELLTTKCPNSNLSVKSKLLIAEEQCKKGETEKAVDLYKKIIETYPSSEEAQKALSGLKDIFVKNNTVGSYLDYTAGLKGIIKIETGEEDTLAYQAAETALNQQKNTEAIEAYQYYLNRFPGGAFVEESQFQLGRVLLSTGRLQEGLNQLESLSNQTGGKYQVSAVMLLAEGYVSSRNHAMALNQYKKLESLASDRFTRQSAIMGIIRSSFALELYKNAIDATNRLLNDENPGTDLQREALYYRALSYIKEEKPDLALKDLKVLGADVDNELGAESRFRLAECLFDEGRKDEAKEEINSFLKQGSPHAYWLAKSYILLADLCISDGQKSEAKQHLTSLKQNYKESNDIQEMIESRLKQLSK